ncbi:MAG: terminase family protein [Magnetococcus sp. WYHC-3]
MSNAPYKLTKEEVLAEAKKCGRDPVYFINNYCRIAHPMRGLIPFKLYKFQEEAVRSFSNNRFNILLKARQLGCSSIVAAYVSHLILFHRNKTVLVVATKLETAKNLVKKVKLIFKNLPDYMQLAKPIADNSLSLEISNGSIVKASANSADAGRSESLSLLICDEAAFVEGLDTLWAAIYPTLSLGGSCLMLSTPNGVGNFFHKTYVDAETGQNDFFPIKLPWNVHPERDDAWFLKETRNMSKKDIAQELLCSFNMSGETVFDPEDIERLKLSVKPPLHRTGPDRNYWIWSKYNPSHTYVQVCDVARGDGKDFSVFHILNLNTMEIVAEYQGKLATDMYSVVVSSAGKEYGNCLIVVENNSVGVLVLKELQNMNYPNIYFSEKGSHDYVEQIEAEYRSNVVGGFTTSQKTRPLLIAKAEEYIRNKVVTIYSQRLINEMGTFVWNNGRPEAMRTYNDDLIMAFGIMCWVRDTALTVNTREIEYQRVFLDCIMKKTTTLDTTIVGQKGHEVPNAREQKEIYGDYTWIYKK